MLKTLKITTAALCFANVSGVAQADTVGDFLELAVNDGLGFHAGASLDIELAEPSDRRAVCALSMSYSALLGHQGREVNRSIGWLNRACAERLERSDWGPSRR